MIKYSKPYVAHPDNETLWAGGEILDNPLWQRFVFVETTIRKEPQNFMKY